MAAPFFKVTLEGIDISSWVQGVTISEVDDGANRVTLLIPDGYFVYSDVIHEGGALVVELGYLPQPHSIFLCGVITGIAAHYSSSATQIRVTAYDESILASHEHKQKAWQPPEVVSLQQLVLKLAASSGWAIGKIATPEVVIERPIVQETSDLALLLALAQRYGCRCFVEYDDDEPLFYFVDEELLVAPNPRTQTLAYGENLWEFSPSFQVHQLPRSVAVVTQDPETGEIAEKIEESGNPPSWHLDVGRASFQSFAREYPGEARKIAQLLPKLKIAQTRYLQSILAKPLHKLGVATHKREQIELHNERKSTSIAGMQASGRCPGNIWLRPGETIEIAGLANRFNGHWYVKNVTHTVDESGYTCQFSCER